VNSKSLKNLRYIILLTILDTRVRDLI